MACTRYKHNESTSNLFHIYLIMVYERGGNGHEWFILLYYYFSYKLLLLKTIFYTEQWHHLCRVICHSFPKEKAIARNMFPKPPIPLEWIRSTVISVLKRCNAEHKSDYYWNSDNECCFHTSVIYRERTLSLPVCTIFPTWVKWSICVMHASRRSSFLLDPYKLSRGCRHWSTASYTISFHGELSPL